LVSIISLICLQVGPWSSCKKSDSESSTNQNQSENPASSPTPSNGPGAPSSGSLAIAASLPTGSDADTAMVMAVTGSGSLSFQNAVSSPISGGSLAISLNASQTALLLQNAEPSSNGSTGTSASKGALLMTLKSSTDRFDAGASMKFVEIPAATGSENTLVKMPTDLLADSSKADLGALSESNGSFVANSVDAATLVKSEATGKINELASTDNGLKLVRNAYMNGELGSEKYFVVSPQYMFSGDLRPFLTSSDFLASAISGASKNLRYHAYLLRFEGKHPDLTVAGLCKDSLSSPTDAPDELKLTPPQKDLSGASQTPVLTFNKDECTSNCPQLSELTSKGSYKKSADECYSDFDSNTGNYFVFANQTRGDGSKALNFNWGSGHGFQGSIPEGLWDLTIKKGNNDATLIGRFDLASAFPLSDDTATAYPVVYMPAMKITKDSSDKLTGFSLKWMLWNPAKNAYDEVTDLSLVKDIVKDMSFHIGDLSTTGWVEPKKEDESIYFDHPTTGHTYDIDMTKLSKPWMVKASGYNVSNDQATPTAHSIAISYAIYGVYYRFDFRPQDL